jgi:hypothetical protein
LKQRYSLRIQQPDTIHLHLTLIDPAAAPPANVCERPGRSVSENIRHSASQSIHDLLKRINGNILLHHFDPLQRRRGDANPPREFTESLIAPPPLEEIGKILPQSSTHGDMVRQVPSHMWDKSLLCA